MSSFYLQTINDLAQSAGNVGGAMEIGLRVARGLKDLIQSPNGASEAEIKAALEQITAAIEKAETESRLVKAQAMLIENELKRIQQAQGQLERYELHRTPAGSHVYALKEGHSSPDGGHFLCPNCYADGRPSILQGDDFQKSCLHCKANLTIQRYPAGHFTRTVPI